MEYGFDLQDSPKGFQGHHGGLGPHLENCWCTRMFIKMLFIAGDSPLPSHCHQPTPFRLAEASELISWPLTSHHSQPWREFFIKHYVIMSRPPQNPPCLTLQCLVSTHMPTGQASWSDRSPNSQPYVTLRLLMGLMISAKLDY